MKRRNERQKGFTLIELLVVLIVIAVVAAVTVPALTSYLDDAREKKAVSEAQVCVTAATEWAAVQRTALISQAYQNNEPFADAYKAAADTAKWSTDYDALNTAAPTVTGTPALAEGDGQYFLRPEPAPTNDTTDADMKATVQTAAGVDGTLQNLQLNADGKVLYLLYTSAEGIPVAYTAAGTAQTPDTTIPVANLPEDTTPTPPTPSHSGDLVFCVLNEYTNAAVPGITFQLQNLDGTTVISDSQTTDKNGMVYFDVKLSEWTKSEYNKKFILHPVSWPEGYQQVFDVEFNINAYDSDNDGYYDNYKINGGPVNTNHSIYKYKDGIVGNLPGGAQEHLYTFYARSVPTLELCVWDDDNNKPVAGVEFTLSKDTKSIPITSSLSPTLLDVKLHEKDNLRPGSDYLYMPYMPNNSTNANLLVEFTNFPEGYQSIDNFYLKIMLENLNGHNAQLCTQFSNQWVGGNQAHTQIECKDLPDQNKSIVTIHVKGGKEVNFFVYDGLDSVHKTQLPNAKLQLCKQDGAVLATFTTDENGKPKGAENFTKTLSEGDYTLHLESGKPDDYTQPADIPFKVEPGAGGLLTLTGDTAYVDTANSTVTMLVTKPNTKRIQLQVVDAITKKPWAGVNVKVTGKCLKADMTKEERFYAINSLANNMHTIDLDSVNGGDIMVTIVGSDNKDSEFKDKYHEDSYINNFVGSKFVFNLKKNTDGTVTLTKTTDKEGFNGDISPDGSTVYVYAYPQVIVDFDTKGVYAGVDLAGRKSILHIVTSEGAIPTTVNGEKLSNWLVKIENRNHSVGLSLGSYKLYEERETLGYYKTLNLPLQFKVTRQTNGFPAVTDWDGNQILDYVTQKPYKDENGNNLPKITAWYQSASYVGP